MDTLRNCQAFGYGKEDRAGTSVEETMAALIWAGDMPISSLIYLNACIWGTQRIFSI